MTTPSLKQIALGDLNHELSLTRRVLERVPDEHMGWKPHEKSMSLGALATHLSTLPGYGTRTLETDEFNFAESGPPNQEATGRDELLSRFDEGAAAFRAGWESVDEAQLGRTWTLRNGDHVIMSQPKMAVLRGLVISHMIHHRAQLGVYLRLLDLPVPSVYGPSADEAPR
jgi:uncharacterized damage-inducible protein DinB